MRFAFSQMPFAKFAARTFLAVAKGGGSSFAKSVGSRKEFLFFATIFRRCGHFVTPPLNDANIEIGKRFSFCFEEQFQNQNRFEVGLCSYGSKRMGICARLVHSDVSHNGFLSKIEPALCRRA